MSRKPGIRVRAAAAAIASCTLLLALPAGVAAHEIPSDVTVQAFVRPRDGRLALLARVPLQALRDYEFPVSGPGYLDLAAAEGAIRQAGSQWVGEAIALYEGARELPALTLVTARVSVPSDRSFRSYETALSNVNAPPLDPAVELYWEQAVVDLLFETPIASDRSQFSIRTELARLGLRTTTVLRFLPPSGADRAFQFVGDPGLVRLDPSWLQAAWRFVDLGFWHILDGTDHLLFLLCLVVPCRRLRPLIAIVTSFTVAHSITLIASVLGLAPGALWFPPLIETLIAMSIVYMALENIVGARPARRWIITFGFGLVHGFGFSFALRETLQFGGAHLITSLLAFNVGVEIGQLLVVAAAVPILNLVFRSLVAERVGTIILSALLAHGAWHWMSDRWSDLRQYRVIWPAFDALLVAALMRGLMLALIIGAALWGLSRLYARLGLAAGDDRRSHDAAQ